MCMIFLQVRFEDDLPFTLCTKCAESIRISYLFKKMCEYSNSQWIKCLENIKNTMELSDNVSSKAQTVYFVSTGKHKLVFFHKKQVVKNKKIALAKVKGLVNGKKRKIIKRNFENASLPPDSFNIDDVMLLTEPQKQKCEQKNKINKEYPCSHCTKVFNSQVKFNDHFDRVHAVRKIMCSKCPEMFSTEKLIRMHEYTYHEPVECKKCCIKFPFRKQLWNHVQRHESTKCKRCKKVFKHKNSYNAHLKICGEKIEDRYKLICDICDKAYLNRKGIRNHLMTTHGFGEAVKCPWCNKKFPSKCHLESHIVKHTRQRDFSCNICGGVFVTAHALKYHIRIHTGEKPFSCDICEETFLNASRKMDHVRRKHLRVMKPCPICHKEYSETAISRHQRRHKDPKSSIYVGKDDNCVVIKKITVE